MGSQYSRLRTWAKAQPGTLLITIGSVGTLASLMAIYTLKNALTTSGSPRLLQINDGNAKDEPAQRAQARGNRGEQEEFAEDEQDENDALIDDMAMAAGFSPDEARLEQNFIQASQLVRGMSGLTTEQQLRLYALFKQANEGPNTREKPGMWDVAKSAKWNAWKDLGAMSKTEAKRTYVQVVTRFAAEKQLSGTGKETKGEAKQDPPTGGQDMGSFGKSQSTILDDSPIVSEKEKNILHYACENKINEIKSLLESKVNVDYTAEKVTSDGQVLGQTALHLASDYGHEDLAKLLVEKKANVNLQDDDGYTPLHYAIVCERTPLIRLLVQSGADVNIENEDGKSAIDFAEDADKDEINEALEI
eukprot:CAMPEP_0184490398 /NCGR_PEP_ID=MMETSP0113_2-20130426/17807_1 /TAXON_ID=91329 /ORGANISM="Norrisiella sphaerica, Strain BC52" /LENGTH=360 /DNA_ID=CAMNT_0026874267 /DNA_START=89 /DNA_END=1171 /DNA_ORIENTATION=-